MLFGTDCTVQNAFDLLDRDKNGEVGKLNVWHYFFFQKRKMFQIHIHVIHVVSNVLKRKKISEQLKITIEITLYDKFGILVIHTKNDETISPR